MELTRLIKSNCDSISAYDRAGMLRASKENDAQIAGAPPSKREEMTAAATRACTDLMATYKPVCASTAACVEYKTLGMPRLKPNCDSTVAAQTPAAGSCKDGWTSGEKGICYRISHVKPDNGTTDVLGEIIVPQKYTAIMLGAALYKGDQLVANCTGSLNEVEKDRATPFDAMCVSEESNPTKVVVRISTAF
jgi:hypothetical protein